MEPEQNAFVDVAKDQLRILLQKMRSDCACHAIGWCTLLELEVASHRDPRMLIQFKCIEKYKYEERVKFMIYSNGLDLSSVFDLLKEYSTFRTQGMPKIFIQISYDGKKIQNEK